MSLTKLKEKSDYQGPFLYKKIVCLKIKEGKTSTASVATHENERMQTGH